ncbi:CHAT domain-containing protein [Paracrocinitomix mangrovi]|uniref:CHAT domain-containing protein n=1 Tax=Paracrocinitomix mangrovi TaxID=2862509 RepID=UPI001C8E8539|nr:CHAT domain-containing tetratricopeptide repeat protein [Paracrocinitomix mangrovi]UKN03704.1 CHAT domain-containing protein [Paracrocinitomix mangrovi]
MNRFLFALLLLIGSAGYSQKYADKEYYLVDSLPYDDLYSDYQIMVDHYLKFYHEANDDLTRVSAIYEIVRNCWDEKVWPLYNEWVHDFTNQKLQEDLSDSLNYIYNQLNIGTIYYRGWGHFYKTNYQGAIDNFQLCYQRYSEIGDQQGAANAIDNIGSVYSTKGEIAKALEFHVQGLEIRESIQDTMGLGASYNAMGIIHMSHGDYFTAIDELEKAVEFHSQVGFWAGVASEYSNIGHILSMLEDYEQSLEFHVESYRIKELLQDKQGMAISLANVARICVLAGDTATAIQYTNYGLQLSQELGDQRGIAGAKSYLGFIHFLKGEYEEGEKHVKEALKIATEVGSQIEMVASWKHLFMGYLWWEKYDEAEIYLNKLVEMRKNDIKINFAILPEQQKEMYFNTMAEEYENLYAYGHFIKDQNPDITITLYDNTLLLKGLLLQSTTAMREAILGSNDQGLIEQYDQWILLKTQIADAYAKGLETEKLEKSANTLEQELVKKSASFDKFQNGKSVSWKDIKSNLTPAAAAIEFIRFPQNIGDENSPIIYSALIVKPNSKQPELVDLCYETDLQEILGLARANNISFVNDVYGTADSSNQALSQLIWEPLKSSLKGVDQIYFAPDGLLHKVAFSAIRVDDEHYLSDKFELFQMGSTAEMLSKQGMDFSKENVATLFGGVKYSTDSSEHVIWNYLPGSLEETDSIQKIINAKSQLNYYKGYEASEAQFKQIAGESNILHIATHGFFYPDPAVVRQATKEVLDNDDLAFRGNASNYGIWNFVSNENPLMRSGLAMAGANDAWQRDVFAEGEDGVLSAQEVSNLNLTNTELVVLSACETGLGDIRGSEGVYGLQRAFKMAGVHYLIMSLWQVPDAETAKFMTLFYDNLFALKDIRKAFNAAQSEMRKQYDPYYWAAFVLIE